MYVGNEMRYLNHMGPKRKEDNTNGATPEEEANCRGRGEKWVMILGKLSTLIKK